MSTTNDKTVYLDKAIEKAIEDALRKPKSIAKTAGFKLGKKVSVEEIPQADFYDSYTNLVNRTSFELDTSSVIDSERVK